MKKLFVTGAALFIAGMAAYGIQSISKAQNPKLLQVKVNAMSTSRESSSMVTGPKSYSFHLGRVCCKFTNSAPCSAVS